MLKGKKRRKTFSLQVVRSRYGLTDRSNRNQEQKLKDKEQRKECITTVWCIFPQIKIDFEFSLDIMKNIHIIIRIL
jgi:phage terminase Nu1 subunit (DNA packaging protein)